MDRVFRTTRGTPLLRYAGPKDQERFKWMMDRRWNEQSHSPAELRQRHLDNIGDRPDLQDEWASRPDDSEFSDSEWLHQDTLPGMGDIRGTDGRLMRGLPIDTNDPQFRRVWQMTHGQGQSVDDPGMFPDADLRYEDRGGQFDNPGLADAILEGLSGGTGEHWSTDYDVADNYGWGIGEGSDVGSDWQNSGHLPVFMDADWNGRGESYDRAGSGNVEHEKEITLNNGAPLKLRDLRVPPGKDHYDDYPNEWNSILDDSRDIVARHKLAVEMTEEQWAQFQDMLKNNKRSEVHWEAQHPGRTGSYHGYDEGPWHSVVWDDDLDDDDDEEQQLQQHKRHAFTPPPTDDEWEIPDESKWEVPPLPGAKPHQFFHDWFQHCLQREQEEEAAAAGQQHHSHIDIQPDMNVQRQVRKFDRYIQQARDIGDHGLADYATHLKEQMLDGAANGRPQPFSYWIPMAEEEFG